MNLYLLSVQFGFSKGKNLITNKNRKTPKEKMSEGMPSNSFADVIKLSGATYTLVPMSEEILPSSIFFAKPKSINFILKFEKSKFSHFISPWITPHLWHISTALNIS